MSAIRVRSSRFRSLLLVVGADHSRGQVGGQPFQLGPAWQRWQRLACGRQRLFGVGECGEFGFPPSLQSPCHQTVLGFDSVEGAVGAVGLVAGAFDGQLGGAAEAVVPVGDLVGGGQRQRDLVRVQRGQQPLGDRVVDGGRGHRAARRGGVPIGAARALVGGALVGVVVGAHRLAARSAGDDALTQRRSLAWWARPGVGAVGGQPGLVGQVLGPADIAVVVVADEHRPLGAGPFDEPGVHAAVRVDGARERCSGRARTPRRSTGFLSTPSTRAWVSRPQRSCPAHTPP